MLIAGLGGKGFYDEHVEGSIRIINNLNLDSHDNIYFSHLFFHEKAPYRDDIYHEGINGLSYENDLPLSRVLSWLEQKAVAFLLTLLHMGIKDIRLGPSLPAFVSENVLNILVKEFNIMPITAPEEDIKAILG